jgi:ATP-dependent RNA helicase DDX20
VIGTPGRLQQLCHEGILVTSNIRLLIFDEADKLFEEVFRPQIAAIYSALPERKQFLAFSATYTNELLQEIASLMRDPQYVLLSSDSPSLQGVTQFYVTLFSETPPTQQPVPIGEKPSTITTTTTTIKGIAAVKSFDSKVQQVEQILNKLEFHQCLIFCNDRARGQQLADKLTSQGWPAAFISGDQDQTQRLQAMAQLKSFELRILVSTDLTSRGVDFERINLVINLDLPRQAETYLHRIGRTGRFGTFGLAISLLSTQGELATLLAWAKLFKTSIQPLPEEVSPELYAYELSSEDEKKKLSSLEAKRVKITSLENNNKPLKSV